jgi:hypothetical protein
MTRKSALFTGVILGLLHGIILWSAIIQYSLVSYMAFERNAYYLPFIITGLVDVTALLTVLTSGYWLPFTMSVRDDHVREMTRRHNELFWSCGICHRELKRDLDRCPVCGTKQTPIED